MTDTIGPTNYGAHSAANERTDTNSQHKRKIMRIYQFGEDGGTCDWVVAGDPVEASAVLLAHIYGGAPSALCEDIGVPVLVTDKRASALNFVDEEGTRIHSMLDEAAMSPAARHLACTEW